MHPKRYYFTYLILYIEVIALLFFFKMDYSSISEYLPFNNTQHFIPLNWSSHEVQDISKYCPCKTFTGNSATKSQFKYEYRNADIIHLAAHAEIDLNRPVYSRFIFAREADRTESSCLHAYEILSMPLDAQMVVLSACNTGRGKFIEGEGMMSLARCFYQAGCRGLITSLWDIDDKSTSQLMDLFYHSIFNGQTKDGALREAKLKFIANTDNIHAAPYFWAGLVNVGDSSPVRRSLSAKDCMENCTIKPFR